MKVSVNIAAAIPNTALPSQDVVKGSGEGRLCRLQLRSIRLAPRSAVQESRKFHGEHHEH